MGQRGTSVGVKITGDAKDFKTAASDAAKAVQQLKSKIESHTKGMRDMFNTLKGTLTGAFSIGVATTGFVKVMKSTGESADLFERNLEGIKEGFESIKRSIATLDFKDFSKNLRNAFLEGKRYADSLDQIDENTRALKIAESDANDEIIKQKIIQNSALSTSAQRIKAGERILELEKRLTEIRLGIANQGYKNEITNIATITHLTNAEVEGYLRGEKAMKDKIEAGKAINEEREKLRNYNLTLAGGIALTAEGSKEYGLLIKKFKEGLSVEQERFSFAARQMATDEKLNLAVERYVELGDARRSGDEETLRVQTKLNSELAKGVKIIEQQIEKQTEVSGLDRAKITLFPGRPVSVWKSTLAEAPAIREATDALEKQKEMVNGLTSVFTDMFSNVDQGFKGMITSMIESLERLVAELLARAAVFAILKILFPEVFLGMGLAAKGSFGKFLGFASGTNFAPGGLSLVGERGPELVNLPRGAQVTPIKNQIMQVEFRGKIKGKDLELIRRRNS
jgi:hypothetical protein